MSCNFETIILYYIMRHHKNNIIAHLSSLPINNIIIQDIHVRCVACPILVRQYLMSYLTFTFYIKEIMITENITMVLLLIHGFIQEFKFGNIIMVI